MGYIPEDIRGKSKLKLADPPTDPVPILLKLASGHGPWAFVETGTLAGGLLMRMANSMRFDNLYSIEQADKLHILCVEKFKKMPWVHLYHGSSRTMLGQMIEDAGSTRILFWLDAHYSGGTTGHDEISSCPLREELKQIAKAKRKDHVIVIDDMRDMPMKSGFTYPSHDEIQALVCDINPKYKMQLLEEHTGMLVAST